jgi:hypothetical protein
MVTLRIATLNCLNLALAGRRIYDGWPPYTPDEYIAKTQWLATLLDRLGADFVLVQEVFHEQALSDVVRQTAGGARAWSLQVPAGGDDNVRPRLGLAWRRTWQVEVESLADLPPGCAVALPELGEATQFSRPLLRARVGLPPGSGAAALTLLNVHLKSRRPEFAPGEDPEDPLAGARAQLRSLLIRGAEAAAVRQVVTQDLAAGGPLIVAGDFNDEARAVTTRIVADTSFRGDDGPRPAGPLFNALDLQARPWSRWRDVAYTVLAAGEPESIDHVLVSGAFVPAWPDAIGRVEAVEILNDHLVERSRAARLGAGRIVDAIDLQRIYSDHAAVCATVVIGDYAAGGG